MATEPTACGDPGGGQGRRAGFGDRREPRQHVDVAIFGLPLTTGVAEVYARSVAIQSNWLVIKRIVVSDVQDDGTRTAVIRVTDMRGADDLHRFFDGCTHFGTIYDCIQEAYYIAAEKSRGPVRIPLRTERLVDIIGYSRDGILLYQRIPHGPAQLYRAAARLLCGSDIYIGAGSAPSFVAACLCLT